MSRWLLLLALLLVGCPEDRQPCACSEEEAAPIVEVEDAEPEECGRCILVTYCRPGVCPDTGCCEDVRILDACHGIGGEQCYCRSDNGFRQLYQCQELADCPTMLDLERGSIARIDGRQYPGECAE